MTLFTYRYCNVDYDDELKYWIHQEDEELVRTGTHWIGSNNIARHLCKRCTYMDDKFGMIAHLKLKHNT